MTRTAVEATPKASDPVYEGKSMAALVDLVREGFFPTGSRVLYTHLGGQPALNASTSAF